MVFGCSSYGEGVVNVGHFVEEGVDDALDKAGVVEAGVVVDGVVVRGEEVSLRMSVQNSLGSAQ